jgi:hypothetical protein
MRAQGTAGVLLLVLTVSVVAWSVLSPAPQASAASQTGLTSAEAHAIVIDAPLFDASIPGTAHVGENISVLVHITNTSNQTLPIIVGLTVPVSILYVSPLLIHTYIGPNGQLTETFYMVVIQQNQSGAAVVTAKVWIWFVDAMPAPQLVAQTSASVYSIRPSPEAPLAAAGVLLVTVATVSVVLLVRRRSSRTPPPAYSQNL